MVLEKTLESPLNCKDIQSVHPKRNQSWIFIWRTETETLIIWLPHAKNWLIWKDPDAGKDWRQEENRTTKDEMVGWHHWLNTHELSKLQELVMDRDAWSAVIHAVTKSRTWLSDWTELKKSISMNNILCCVCVCVCDHFPDLKKGQFLGKLRCCTRLKGSMSKNVHLLLKGPKL